MGAGRCNFTPMNTHVKNSLKTDLHDSTSALELHGVGMELPGGTKDAPVPEWIHLLPAGEIKTVDGRGPYKIADLSAVIAASMGAGQKLVIDINHATDRLAAKGQEAPAQGWIVELQSRDTGLWARVEWTKAGREKIGGREYRYISPAIQRDGEFNISAILRASLVNNPNLLGLAELNSESKMNFLEKLRKALNLKDDAGEAAILVGVTGLAKNATDLQAALDPIAGAAGLKAGASQTELLDAVTGLAKTAPEKTDGIDQGALIVDLQTSLKTMTKEVAELRGDTKRKAAEAFVDAAILKGRVGVKSQRDRFVDMHMADAKSTEDFVNSLPELGSPGAATLKAPAPKDGKTSLTPDQAMVADLMGIDHKSYAKRLADEQIQLEVI